MLNDPRTAKPTAADGQFAGTRNLPTAKNAPDMRYGTEPARFDNQVAFNVFLVKNPSFNCFCISMN